MSNRDNDLLQEEYLNKVMLQEMPAPGGDINDYQNALALLAAMATFIGVDKVTALLKSKGKNKEAQDLKSAADKLYPGPPERDFTKLQQEPAYKRQQPPQEPPSV